MATDDDPVLSAEREQLRRALECLEHMRADADRIADHGVDELASFALGRLRAERLAALSADPDAPPFFGRTDNDSDTPAGVETFHIGRRHVRDPDGDPVVVDWRAPVARPFYRATAHDRQGVRLRRRFGFAHRAGAVITSYEDERLDRGQSLGLESDLLREEIERPRVGPMRDIVATIQPDQDELVRADLATSLCVQGAPGTGKTAVGLHRAAYLLYTYPDRLRRSGVLVVGPNQAFLHYIAQVLPALGEQGIQQATVPELAAHVAVRGRDAPEVADLKGDERMAAVLRRALLTHVGRPAEDVVALVGTKRYRIAQHRLRRYVDDARRAVTDPTGDTRELHWATARDRLRMQLAEDVRRQREDVGGAPTDGETRRLARSPAVREFVDAVWPAISAPELLARLYSDDVLLARAAAGILGEDEQRLLHRPAARSVRATRWTAPDAVLIDELVDLIDGVPGFVHAVVDEAQDLSAMQCRVVARRCPLGSLTVLGDLAQATTTWAPGSWAATLRHLGRAGARVHPLTAGYRVPGSVLALANRLLPHIARDVPPATSVRAGADALTYRPRADLVEAVRGCLAAEGSVGVIVADNDVAAVSAALAGEADPDRRLTVVPAGQAKGLEYDSVVLVEPADIVAAEPQRTAGLRRLYVVLTRAVSRLVIVHDQPLPPELTG